MPLSSSKRKALPSSSALLQSLPVSSYSNSHTPPSRRCSHLAFHLPPLNFICSNYHLLQKTYARPMHAHCTPRLLRVNSSPSRPVPSSYMSRTSRLAAALRAVGLHIKFFSKSLPANAKNALERRQRPDQSAEQALCLRRTCSLKQPQVFMEMRTLKAEWQGERIVKMSSDTLYSWRSTLNTGEYCSMRIAGQVPQNQEVSSRANNLRHWSLVIR